MLFTPVVLIFYNRPNFTKKVVEQIIKANPPKVYAISDGPKTSKEINLVNQTRDLVEKSFDMSHIGIEKIYSNTNLGLEKRICSGLDYVFQLEEKAIILEDDCVPEISFFQFCQEMLTKYETEEKVSHISGSRYVDVNNSENKSYYFSKYPLEWGWATWKSEWMRYDSKMSDWQEVSKDSTLRKKYDTKKTYKYWHWIFKNCYNGSINSWAYKWFYRNIVDGKLSIIPKYNLINNIGMGSNSTNTKLKSRFLTQRTQELAFPLESPKKLCLNDENDKLQEIVLYNKSVLWLEVITKRIKPIIKE